MGKNVPRMYNAIMIMESRLGESLLENHISKIFEWDSISGTGSQGKTGKVQGISKEVP